MLDIMCIYIYMYIYINIVMYILKAWIKTAWCWHPLPWHTWSVPRDVDPTFPTTPPGPQFLRKLGPDFQDTGLEIEPRFPAKPLHRKSVPNLGRAWEESSLRPCGCKLVFASNYAKSGWPARPYIFVCYMPIAPGPGPTKSKIQNPNSKLAVWILDLGFWI